jgi:ABC-2 type transport system permease protein
LAAVFRRDFAAYFTTTLGYIFIALFSGLSSVAAFWPDEFFAYNLANLDSLNFWFPYLLLFFVPAVTMRIWAEERKEGTDELLLTLPATDMEIVLGKYLAVLGIYLASLLFSVSHVFVLAHYGNPDPGLMFSNYLGFAVLGAALLTLGMIGSLLTNSMTVAFILGALLCAALVFLEPALTMIGVQIQANSILAPFRDLTSGVLSVRAGATTLAMIATMIYLSLVVLGVRRQGWRTPHPVLRLAGLALAAAGLTVLAGRSAARADLTAERINTLSAVTLTTLAELKSDRPVLVHLYASPNVPAEYVETHKTLLALLREYEARAGGGLIVDVVETQLSSRQSREAKDHYGIEPVPVPTTRAGTEKTERVFLGAAFICGAEEVIVPFFFRGISVEYELTRSIRVVSKAARKKVAVLATDARVFGGFDFAHGFNPMRSWLIVEELRKQYNVVEQSPDSEYAGDLDLLVAILPSSLTQEQLDRLHGYVMKGKPALLIDDPVPWFNPNLGPSQPKGGARNPFMGMNQPPPQPKGDIEAFFKAMGVRWPSRDVIWNSYNPHPRLGDIPLEFVFIGRGTGAAQPFHPTDPAVADLQEVVVLFAGRLESADVPGITFTPLIKNGGENVGTVPEARIFERNFMGQISDVNRNPPRRRNPGAEHTVAARVEGTAGQAQSVRAVVLADSDLISDGFFGLRRNAPKDLQLDNVTLVLNLIDGLTGDDAFVKLRSRRPRHRTLTTIEKTEREFEKARLTGVQEAEDAAEGQLAKAQTQLNEAVEALRNRTDLDERAKAIMIRQREEDENRKLDAQRATIETEKAAKIDEAQTRMIEQIRWTRARIRAWALAVPLIPSLALALGVFIVRGRRERKAA